MLKLLLNYLLSFGFVGFAAGASALDGGGGGAVDSALVDVAGEGGESTETPTEETTDEPVETEDETPEGQATQKTEKVDLRVIPQDIKKHIQELSKTSPKLANLLQNSVYTAQSFLKEFPGGIKDVQSFKSAIDEVGGIEEVRNLKQTHQALVDEQESLDKKAADGNPEILDNLLEISGKEGFSKLMPAALDKWRSANPEEYSYQMAQVMVEALKSSNVVGDLNLAFRMINLKNGVGVEEGVQALKRVAAAINGIGQRAASAPQKPQVDPRVKAEQDELSNERQKLFNEKFGNQYAPWRDSEIKRLVREVAPKGKVFNDYQMSTLNERVQSELRAVLSVDTQYIKSLERLYQAKNMDELLKFTKNRTSKVLFEAVKKAYNGLFRDAGPKKKLAVVNNNQKTPQSGQKNTPAGVAAPVTKGWTKVAVASAPTPDEIDNSATDFKMKFNKQAILKDGRRVYWGDKAPK